MNKNVIISILIIIIMALAAGLIYFGFIKEPMEIHNNTEAIEEHLYKEITKENDTISEKLSEVAKENQSEFAKSFSDSLVNAIEDESKTKSNNNNEKQDIRYFIFKSIFNFLTNIRLFFPVIYVMLLLLGFINLIKGQAVKRNTKIGWTLIISSTTIFIGLKFFYLWLMLSYLK